ADAVDAAAVATAREKLILLSAGARSPFWLCLTNGQAHNVGNAPTRSSLAPILCTSGWYAPDRKPTEREMEACDEEATHLGAASIAVLLLIVMPVASQAPQAEKTFSGTLTKVDAAKNVITVKGIGAEPEMTFTYDDKTLVTGAEKTIQGLTGKSGAML